MIARKPEKKYLLNTMRFSPLIPKIANDNHPPKRKLLIWLFFLAGLLLFLGAAFWVYEKAISYYRDATQWTEEQALNSQQMESTGKTSEINKRKAP